MQNIVGLQGKDNISGIYSFNFIETLGIYSIPVPLAFLITGPCILNGGYSWKSAEFTEGTGEIKIQSIDSQAGTFKKFSLEAFIPNITKAKSENFEMMTDHRFILDVFDFNKNRKLIGDKKNGCSFSFTEGTAKNGSGIAGYNISFYSEATSIYHYSDAATEPSWYT